MIKPNTRVRHIVTRTEGIVVDMFSAVRLWSLGRAGYVQVKLPNSQKRVWRIENVEEVRP